MGANAGELRKCLMRAVTSLISAKGLPARSQCKREQRSKMSMNVIRLNIRILVLLVSLAIAWVVTAGRAAETPRSTKQPDHATAGELRRLLKARYEIAANLLEIEEKRLNEGKSTLRSVYEAARRVRDSAVELTGDRAEQIAALTKYLAVAHRLEDSVNKVVEVGAATPSDRELARYLRLDAEIALLRAKQQNGQD